MWYWKIFKGEEAIRILKILDSIKHIEEYQIITLTNMAQENSSQEFRLTEVDERRSYFNEELN